MNIKSHHELIRHLTSEYCLLEEDVLYVDSVAQWCGQNGIPEPDGEKPIKMVSKEGVGCKIIVAEDVPDKAVERRINALSVRGALINVARDAATGLNTDNKKLAYIFLKEYAGTRADIQGDLSEDKWALEEMERLGFFKA